MTKQVIILTFLCFVLNDGCKNTVAKQSLNLEELGIENTSDAISVDGLQFEENKIEQTDTYKAISPVSPNLKVVNCNRVIIGNNIYKSLSGKKGTLSIDKNTTNINLINNETFISVN